MTKAAFVNISFRNHEQNFLSTFRAGFETKFGCLILIAKKRRSVCPQQQAAKPRLKTCFSSRYEVLFLVAKPLRTKEALNQGSQTKIVLRAK